MVRKVKNKFALISMFSILKFFRYYDTESQDCEKFNYGGCKGNGNNFVSEVQCLQKCGDESDLALLPQVEITTEIGKYIEL